MLIKYVIDGVVIVLAFLLSHYLVKYWYKSANKVRFVGKDINKAGRPAVPEMGGIPTVLSFVFAVLIYLGVRTFYLSTGFRSIEILAVVGSVLIALIIGMLDGMLGWRKGLKQWQKPLMTIFAAIPLIAISAGHHTMHLPFLGEINVGILYALLIIPIGIVGASNAANVFAGFNGLEPGLATIILGTLGVSAWLTGSGWVAMLAFLFVAATLGLWWHNKYPAKVFVGDTFTYTYGTMAAIIAILANLEAFAVFLFLPHIIDFLVFKLPNKFPSRGWHGTFKEGKLTHKGKPIHLAQAIMKLTKGISEKRLVVVFHVFELILAALVIIWILM